MAESLSSQLKSYMKENKITRAVIGVSGGVDSAAALAILEMAVGAKNITALILPSSASEKKDIQDAKKLCSLLNVGYSEISLAPLLRQIEKSLSPELKPDRLTMGNAAARLRMLLLYSFAGKKNAIVVGTGDKSEYMIGYFTKYGDGGCDIFPIADLYKCQVRLISKELGIPKNICQKPSSPNLWKGQTAEKELGISYDDVDAILYALEKKIPKKEIEKEIGRKKVQKVLSLMKESGHKRRQAPTLEPYAPNRK